jgi:hypothetical protein
LVEFPSDLPSFAFGGLLVPAIPSFVAEVFGVLEDQSAGAFEHLESAFGFAMAFSAARNQVPLSAVSPFFDEQCSLLKSGSFDMARFHCGI